MSTTNMTLRVDEKLKRQADELFSDLGMNMTTAVMIFLKQAVREQRIPFNISREIPNDETRKAIEETQKGIGLSKPYNSVSELMEDLNVLTRTGTHSDLF